MGANGGDADNESRDRQCRVSGPPSSSSSDYSSNQGRIWRQSCTAPATRDRRHAAPGNDASVSFLDVGGGDRLLHNSDRPGIERQRSGIEVVEPYGRFVWSDRSTRVDPMPPSSLTPSRLRRPRQRGHAADHSCGRQFPRSCTASASPLGRGACLVASVRVASYRRGVSWTEDRFEWPQPERAKR
jgi:hypothetical protein